MIKLFKLNLGENLDYDCKKMIMFVLIYDHGAMSQHGQRINDHLVVFIFSDMDSVLGHHDQNIYQCYFLSGYVRKVIFLMWKASFLFEYIND